MTDYEYVTQSPKPVPVFARVLAVIAVVTGLLGVYGLLLAAV